MSSLKSVSIHQSDSGSSREKKIPLKVNVKLVVITVTTDEDSGSEDDDYGDTKEERNEVEGVEPEESDSPTFKVAKIKPLCETRWVQRHTAF